jgi:hypothetical protein
MARGFLVAFAVEVLDVDQSPREKAKSCGKQQE